MAFPAAPTYPVTVSLQRPSAPPVPRPAWPAAAGWPLLLAAGAVAANGYQFGTTDQAIHLTFVRALLDPGAMAGDLVADRAAAHASLWWTLQVPAVQALGWDALPALYLALYLVALVATFALLYALGRELLADPRAALLAPALLVVFKACPAHVYTFEPELINRTLTHPLLLWALLLLFRGRPVQAGAMCGLAFNLHASTAAHTAAAVAVAAAVDPGLRRRLPAVFGAFAAGAAPLLATVALRGGPGPWWVDPEWMQVLRWRMPHHLMPWRWPSGVWLAGAFQLALWFAAARFLRDDAVRRRGHGLVLGVLLCGPLLGTAVAGPLPVAPLLALHLWESWLLLALLAYLASAGLVTALASTGGIPRRLAAAALLLVLIAGPEGSVMGVDRRPVFRWRAPAGEDRALARYLEQHGSGPLLVAPVGTTWLRPATGRALFVTVKDGGEAVFDRELALGWRARLTRLCGTDVLTGAPPPGEWRGYRTVGLAATDAFAARSTSALRTLATEERAWQLVVPASLARDDLDPVFTTRRFLVYDLRQVPRPPEEP